MEFFKKKTTEPKEVVHNCIMSRCVVNYDPHYMYYTVVFQCRDCGKLHSVTMTSDNVHDFLKAVTMGY